MSPNKQFLEALFRPGESVCYAQNQYGTTVYKLEEALEMEPMELVSANPLHTRRLDANVTAHRNLVFEFDGGTIEEQADIINSKKLPYNTLTFSGGKSLHAIVSLADSVGETELRKYFKLIRYVMWQTDPSCVNPSRLTRVAGAIRKDKNDEEQLLIDIRAPITEPELKLWLRRFRKHIDKCIEKEQEAIKRKQERLEELKNSGVELGSKELLSEATQLFLKGEGVAPQSRHRRLLLTAHEYLQNGIAYEEAVKDLEMAAILWGVFDRDPGKPQQIVDYVYGS